MEAIDTRTPDVAEQGVVELEEDLGADLSDDELGELLVREVTIDGMCGVY
jgi:mycofactocin precursor